MSELLEPQVVELLRADLPTIATNTIEAIMVEVPAYRGALDGVMGVTIANAVEVALAGFLVLAVRGRGDRAPRSPAIEGAYRLGRGEARSGRSAEALLSAYRVGARVSWRDLSATCVRAGVDAAGVARFAELVFAYIDELSAASVAGHSDEVETAKRSVERRRAALARYLLDGAAPDVLEAAAERAEWHGTTTLTAVIVPEAQVRPVLAQVTPQSLAASEAPGLADGREVLLIADMDGRRRAQLLQALEGRHAVVGPDRPWPRVQVSYRRALRAMTTPGVTMGSGPVDTEQWLAELVLSADEAALADLRARVLAPLDDLTATQRQKLAETLRAWLLHHGRRESIAGSLFIHPQTVRYRLGQLRDLYGEHLEDPVWVRDLTLALAVDADLSIR
ncbi:PucR family transcriptional regulator [Millisia brevis]|uniref:PucR family transcriptional regulator n=1 Tax=Millisia brevis TaxID=264148 RepID=UPI000AF08B9B|nr:helix-turn-helix domain-containing protein [Millisia brevis]